VIRQFYFVGNVYHFNSRKVKQQQFLICTAHYSPLKNCCSVVSVKKKNRKIKKSCHLFITVALATDTLFMNLIAVEVFVECYTSTLNVQPLHQKNQEITMARLPAIFICY